MKSAALEPARGAFAQFAIIAYRERALREAGRLRQRELSVREELRQINAGVALRSRIPA